MPDQIKELIEKINQEGVVAAQEKARAIEQEAAQKAEMLIERATAQAKQIIDNAQEAVIRMQESSEAGLKQASRDLILVLKKQINELLQKVITVELRGMMSAEELSRMLGAIIKESCSEDKKDVIVFLNDQDRNKLEGHFLNKLKDEVKKGISLESSQDIEAGFIISFDSGRSQFDFSDKALAQYFISNLKPKLAQIFKDTE